MQLAHTLADQAFQQLIGAALGWLLGFLGAALRRRSGGPGGVPRSRAEPGDPSRSRP